MLYFNTIPIRFQNQARMFPSPRVFSVLSARLMTEARLGEKRVGGGTPCGSNAEIQEIMRENNYFLPIQMAINQPTSYSQNEYPFEGITRSSVFVEIDFENDSH